MSKDGQDQQRLPVRLSAGSDLFPPDPPPGGSVLPPGPGSVDGGGVGVGVLSRRAEICRQSFFYLGTDERLTSVDNALWLMQLVAERQALRVSEAADLLGVARSTAHRLLSALRRRDFLTQDKPNGAYRPGPALHAIGMMAISRLDIRRIAQPVLERLRDETKETASLAVIEGTMIRFVECYEGSTMSRPACVVVRSVCLPSSG